jgi:hypothetical protein
MARISRQKKRAMIGFGPSFREGRMCALSRISAAGGTRGSRFCSTAPIRMGFSSFSYRWSRTLVLFVSSDEGMVMPTALMDQERWCCSRLLSFAFRPLDSL